MSIPGGGDSHDLLVRLRADIDQYLRSMERASRATTEAMGRVSSSTAQAGTRATTAMQGASRSVDVVASSMTRSSRQIQQSMVSMRGGALELQRSFGLLGGVIFSKGLVGQFNLINQAMWENMVRMGMVTSALNQYGNALIGVGLAGAGVVAYFAKQAASAEMTEIAFKKMLGSAFEARQMLAEFQEFALKTPFTYTGIIQTARQLKAYGFEAKELKGIITDLGDAVAGLGGSHELFTMLARDLGQIRAKGHLEAQEIRQMAEAFVNVRQYMADYLDTSVANVEEMVKSRAISADVAIRGILSGLRKDYGGTMDELMQTTEGKWSNLVDQLEESARELGVAFLPTANKLIDGLTGILKAVEGWDASWIAIGTAVAFAGGAFLKILPLWLKARTMIQLLRDYKSVLTAQNEALTASVDRLTGALTREAGAANAAASAMGRVATANAAALGVAGLPTTHMQRTVTTGTSTATGMPTQIVRMRRVQTPYYYPFSIISSRQTVNSQADLLRSMPTGAIASVGREANAVVVPMTRMERSFIAVRNAGSSLAGSLGNVVARLGGIGGLASSALLVGSAIAIGVPLLNKWIAGTNDAVDKANAEVTALRAQSEARENAVASLKHEAEAYTNLKKRMEEGYATAADVAAQKKKLEAEIATVSKALDIQIPKWTDTNDGLQAMIENIEKVSGEKAAQAVKDMKVAQARAAYAEAQEKFVREFLHPGGYTDTMGGRAFALRWLHDYQRAHPGAAFGDPTKAFPSTFTSTNQASRFFFKPAQTMARWDWSKEVPGAKQSPYMLASRDFLEKIRGVKYTESEWTNIEAMRLQLQAMYGDLKRAEDIAVGNVQSDEEKAEEEQRQRDIADTQAKMASLQGEFDTSKKLRSIEREEELMRKKALIQQRGSETDRDDQVRLDADIRRQTEKIAYLDEQQRIENAIGAQIISAEDDAKKALQDRMKIEMREAEKNHRLKMDAIDLEEKNALEAIRKQDDALRKLEDRQRRIIEYLGRQYLDKLLGKGNRVNVANLRGGYEMTEAEAVKELGNIYGAQLMQNLGQPNIPKTASFANLRIPEVQKVAKDYMNAWASDDQASLKEAKARLEVIVNDKKMEPYIRQTVQEFLDITLIN